MPVGTPRRCTYIRLHDEPEHLPEFLLVRSQLHPVMPYIGIPGLNGTSCRI